MPERSVKKRILLPDMQRQSDRVSRLVHSSPKDPIPVVSRVCQSCEMPSHGGEISRRGRIKLAACEYCGAEFAERYDVKGDWLREMGKTEN